MFRSSKWIGMGMGWDGHLWKHLFYEHRSAVWIRQLCTGGLALNFILLRKSGHKIIYDIYKIGKCGIWKLHASEDKFVSGGDGWDLMRRMGDLLLLDGDGDRGDLFLLEMMIGQSVEESWRMGGFSLCQQTCFPQTKPSSATFYTGIGATLLVISWAPVGCLIRIVAMTRGRLVAANKKTPS